MNETERLDADELLLSETTGKRGISIGRGIILVLAGIGIGAGLALLFAPKRGDEVREAIARGYRKTLDDLSQRAQDVRDRVQELRERAPNLIRFGRR